MVKNWPAEVPDTYGLPEFRVAKIIKERKGDEIRMLCGSESFGQLHWHCIIVMKASDVIVESRECEVLAVEAVTEIMRGGVKAH